jgi:hypothetical protein
VGKNNGEHASLSETVGRFARVFDDSGDVGGILKQVDEFEGFLR